MAFMSNADVQAVLDRQDISELIEGIIPESVALRTFRKVPMSAGTARMPLLTALPELAEESGELASSTRRKNVSKVTFDNKDLVAANLGVIIPLKEEWLEDTTLNLWAAIRPLIIKQAGLKIDKWVLKGTGKPAVWTDAAIIPGAIAAGNVAYEDTNALTDLGEDLNATFGLVEDDGFDVNAVIARRSIRQRLRGLRDTAGQPIYLDNLRGDGKTNGIYGEPLYTVSNSVFDAADATAIVGDPDFAVLGIRSDGKFKMLDQASLLDGSDTIYLAQEDAVALRFVMRIAYAVITPLSTESVSPYPFAVLKANAPTTTTTTTAAGTTTTTTSV